MKGKRSSRLCICVGATRRDANGMMMVMVILEPRNRPNSVQSLTQVVVLAR